MLGLGKELDMEESLGLGCNSVVVQEAHTKPWLPCSLPSHTQTVGRKNGLLCPEAHWAQCYSLT